jgi:hypothetical protein
MQLVVAIIILLITLIILALAVFLIATIVELRKTHAGLDRVLGGVGEIATKTAPVNGVLDAINATLLAGRNLLEGLAIKKAGPDAAGLVESCFPGEGQRFLQRVGRNGAVVAIGEDYARGAAILNSLLGAGPAPPPPSAAPQAVPQAAPAVAASSSAAPASGGRISLRRPSVAAPAAGPSPPPPSGAPAFAASSPAARGSGGGRISLRRPSPPASAPASAPGRISARGSRPWE